MKEYLDAISLTLAAIGLAAIFFAPAESIYMHIGLFIAFIGAVVYGGVPSSHPIEAVVAKVPVPVIILGTSLALVLWKITEPAVFFEDILWWAFGSFMIGSIVAPTLQRVVEN